MNEHALCALADIADGDHRVFMVCTTEFGVFRQGENVVAWENRCPHAGGPVCQGKIYRRVGEKIDADGKSQGMHFTDTRQIVCPWHGYEFDVATGRHPADRNVRLKPVEVAVRDGRVYARLPP
jgi:nitrite reductase (NADH) small subunit